MSVVSRRSSTCTQAQSKHCLQYIIAQHAAAALKGEFVDISTPSTDVEPQRHATAIHPRAACTEYMNKCIDEARWWACQSREQATPPDASRRRAEATPVVVDSAYRKSTPGNEARRLRRRLRSIKSRPTESQRPIIRRPSSVGRGSR